MTDEQCVTMAGGDHGTGSESIEVRKTYLRPRPAGEVWPQQYCRMRRSLIRLVDLAEGNRFGNDSDEATDALVHFFQDAFHLKDWIKNDDTVPPDVGVALEHDLFCRGDGKHCDGHVIGPAVMRLCADLCNGAKHHKLNGARRFADSGIASEHVRVRPAAASSGEAARPPLHSWSVLADGVERDALTVAREIIGHWDVWLTDHGMSPPELNQLQRPPDDRPCSQRAGASRTQSDICR